MGNCLGGVSVRGEREKGKDRSEEDGCTIYIERERESKLIKHSLKGGRMERGNGKIMEGVNL
jgi:hypothetical protein